MSQSDQVRAVLHGSFGRHFDLICQTRQVFQAAGIEVIAPKLSDIVAQQDDFLLLEGEEDIDPRLVELRYLYSLKALGNQGFSYFVNPDGYIGRSGAYELAVAQLLGIKCLFMEPPKDLPVYLPPNSVWTPNQLASYLQAHRELPKPMVAQNEQLIHCLWEQLVLPGSVVATGGVIVYRGRRTKRLPEVLLVRTHKWGHRYSMVGGRVQPGERLGQALVREIREETGLRAQPGRHVCTFDQIQDSGYYRDVHHLFVDYVAEVDSRQVRLNHEAQDYLWAPAEAALAELDIEPNARHTLEQYVKLTQGPVG